MNKENFLQRLKKAVQTERIESPTPLREQLTTEQEWQCQVIGGELLSWFRRPLENIMGQRHVLSKIKDFDPKPLIVFTTNVAGLVAADIILENNPDVIYLSPKSWEKVVANLNDSDYGRFVVHHWSVFDTVASTNTHALETAKNEDNIDNLRIHTASEWWGENCGSQGQHLWAFENSEGRLIEEAFEVIRY